MVAKDTPKSRQKVRLLANALLVPVIIWAVSSFLLAKHVMETSCSAAIMISICCTILVFLVERIILMLQGNARTARFSFFLGGCIALVGSLAIAEIVFAEDIDYQIQKNKEKYATQVAAEQGVIFDSVQQMPLKLQSLSALKTAVKEAELLAITEMEGKDINTKATGSLTKEKMAMANARAAILQKDKSVYDSLLHQKALLMQTAKDRTLFESNDGLMVHGHAFFTLVFSDWIMATVFTVFLLLMFFLEFLAVIVKKLVPESNYERQQRIFAEIDERKIKAVNCQDPELTKKGPGVQNASNAKKSASHKQSIY